MVRLMMTQAIVDALNFCYKLDLKGWPLESVADEPSLDEAALGRPISHGQIIDLSKLLRHHLDEHEHKQGNGYLQTANGSFQFSLKSLLRGSKVYVDPPKPKAPPVSLVYTDTIIF